MTWTRVNKHWCGEEMNETELDAILRPYVRIALIAGDWVPLAFKIADLRPRPSLPWWRRLWGDFKVFP